MERLSKHEPQELSNDVQVLLPSHDDAEESKSASEQWMGQPQSLIMLEPPLISDQRPDQKPPTQELREVHGSAGLRASLQQSAVARDRELLCRHPEFRALQSQFAHLRIENEGLRLQLAAELRWLIYFRAPAQKVQVLAIVREGLAALFAKNPLFRSYECATFWVAQERPNWEAFRIDYAGCKLVAFRAAMKAAHADAQMPANAVRTTQPPSVSLYRQPPQVPPLFTGTLEELANALQDAMQQIFIV